VSCRASLWLFPHKPSRESATRQQSFFRVFEFSHPPTIAVLFDQSSGCGKVVLNRFPRVRRRGDWETRRWGETSIRAISLSLTLLVSLSILLSPSLLLSVSPSEEPRSMQMNIGHEQRHRPAGGDLPGFVQVALRAVLACLLAEQTPLPRSREETEGEARRITSAAKVGNGGFDFL